jgi:hypothetical protein
MNVEHRDLALWIAHPDDGAELPGVPVEPGVSVILGRAGLTGVVVDPVARPGPGSVESVLA